MVPFSEDHEKRPQQSADSTTVNTAPLLRRAFMFLEDGEWARADEFCEQVLNIDPENAQAYLGKLMAELQVRKQEDLPDCEQPFDDNSNFQKVLRFGDDQLVRSLEGCITHINERNENTRFTNIYDNAVSVMRTAKSESTYKAAAALFNTIPGFQDSDTLAEQCLEQAEVCRKDTLYADATSCMYGNLADKYETAIKIFQKIPGWRDADEQIVICQLRKNITRQYSDRRDALAEELHRMIKKIKDEKNALELFPSLHNIF